MTDSELRFEDFCNASSIQFDRIPTANHRTPDYLVRKEKFSAVVEVKEITPDEEEKRILQTPWELWGENECMYYGGAPGGRIRKKITNASKQLKGSPTEELPRIIVLANLTSYEEVCDSYAMAVAMFGFETVLISPQAAPEGGATILRKWHGHRRKLTRFHCRTISALASLQMPPSPHLLQIYHNPFSLLPFAPNAFSSASIEHFTVEGDPEVVFTAWKRIVL